VQAWNGNIPGPCDQKISRWANLPAEWYLWCVWTARVYCWWISCKMAQQSIQRHIGKS
jgi:hypothetical protein